MFKNEFNISNPVNDFNVDIVLGDYLNSETDKNDELTNIKFLLKEYIK